MRRLQEKAGAKKNPPDILKPPIAATELCPLKKKSSTIETETSNNGAPEAKECANSLATEDQHGASL